MVAITEDWDRRRNAWLAVNRKLAARPGGLHDLTTEELRAFGKECMDQLREADGLLRAIVGD